MLEKIQNKGNTPPLLVGGQNCTATLEISMAISQKTEKQPTMRPRNTIFGAYPKDGESYYKNF